ncbi:putative HTH-type transcriptional repressor ExuR [compost metagenome]
MLGLLDSGEELPTALFCSNDDMAISAMEAFAERGISIPEDLSIIGFDDVQLAARVNPKLTSVRLPMEEMSKAAVDTIIRLCNGEQRGFSTFSLPTRLVIRDSCKPLLPK